MPEDEWAMAYLDVRNAISTALENGVTAEEITEALADAVADQA